MKHSESLKKNMDFQNVYKNGKSYANKYLVMYVLENNLNKNGGELSLWYTVDVNGSELNRNQMIISIKEV